MFYLSTFQRSSPFPFPSFCYLDFFSCCVMSIIYAKRFAACCTSRASRRGRRSGKGGGSGERRAARGGGEEPRALPRIGTQGLWGRLIETPPRAGLESRSGILCHLPFSRGLGSDNRDSLVVNCPSQRPTSSSCLSSRLEKERELGRHSGSGPAEQLRS